MIQASLIFEMIGRPADHVKDTLNKVIDSMADGKSIKIINKKIAEPKKIEKIEQELYSTFAEVDIEIDSLHNLSLLVLTHMPSHVEVISPAELKFKNAEINSLLNEITMRLHKYDEIAKALGIEREIMKNQIARLKQELENRESETKKSREKKETKTKTKEPGSKNIAEKKEAKTKTKEPKERKKRAKKR